MPGDNLALVDGLPQHLKYPVALYRGKIVVPHTFKESVIDPIFKQAPAGFKASGFSVKKIVVDPGHGGFDPGAIGRSGLREKDVNLDIARRLASLLRSSGIEVVMTRSVDKFISLDNRVKIANNSGAGLFISIHSNANRVRSLKGFEAYYVAENVGDSKRAYAAAKEAPINLERVYFADSSLDLKAILWDMVHTYNRGQSIILSRTICKSMRDNLDLPILGVKGARYQVLKGARMPAILLEVGFLSNYSEERMLKNNFYRQQLAQNIAQGITEGVWQ
jgi:N-acetylmuramoyl-L-alanine amidase